MIFWEGRPTVLGQFLAHFGNSWSIHVDMQGELFLHSCTQVLSVCCVQFFTHGVSFGGLRSSELVAVLALSREFVISILMFGSCDSG